MTQNVNVVKSTLGKRFRFLGKEVGIVGFPEVYEVWKDDSAVFVDGRTAAAFGKGFQGTHGKRLSRDERSC